MAKTVQVPKYVNGKKTDKFDTFYVDTLSDDFKNKSTGRWHTDYQMALKNVKLYNHRFTNGELDIISQVRSLYDKIKQPTEGDVRRAMLMLINEDYALKAGGESSSDRIYSSSLGIWIADPKTGEDKKVALIKKYSTTFSEVLITMEELDDLFEICLSPKEKKGVLEDNALSVMKLLKDRELGMKCNYSDGVKKLMPKQDAINMIKNYVNRGVTPEMFKSSYDKMMQARLDDLKDVYIENETNTVNSRHQEYTRRHIAGLERAYEFLQEHIGIAA